MAEQRTEIDAITGNAAGPDFQNTIDALELSGRTLRRVSAVFFNLTGSHTNPALEKIDLQFAPLLARHRNAIFLDESLFRRIAALEQRQGRARPDA